MEKLAINGGNPVINYTLPSVKDISGRDIGQEEIDAVVEVVKSGNMGFIYGEKIKELQRLWAEKYGVSTAICVSSGTAALHTASIFLDLGPGDEVLVPAITDIGSVLGILLQNAIPVFVDVDVITQNMDPDDIERHITPRTKAIMPVHLFGYPCDMDRIMPIAKRHNLFVIEDCAQAHTTTYKGRLVGTFGDVACYSFQQSKHMTTGDGGMVMVKKDNLCGRKLIQAHDKGWPREVYRDHLFLAPNYHMTDLQGAVGLVQFKKLDTMVENRRKSALHLSNLLKDIDGVMPPFDDEKGTHTFFEYPLPIEPDKFTVGNDVLAQAITAEGVHCSASYLPKPIYMYDVVYKQVTHAKTRCPFVCNNYPVEYKISEDMCPNALKACKSMLYIPWCEKTTIAHAEDIACAIRKVLEFYKK